MISFSRKRKPLSGFMLPIVVCLLGIVLMAGQAGAVVHALSHLDSPPPEKQALADGNCALCAGYSHLSGAVSALSLALPGVGDGLAAALPLTRPSFIQLPCPYQGRAPPRSV